jgi:hypothetical protein
MPSWFSFSPPPAPPPTANTIVHLKGIAIAVALMIPIDALFCRRTKARWWLLHAWANSLITIATASDAIHAIDAPQQSCVGHPSNVLSIYQALALHIYHAAFFNCTRDDIWHHVVFVGTLGALAIYYDFNGGPLVNLVVFFICGLPGGLDYVMLALVKHEKISALQEKAWNTRINVWLRSPGLLLSAFCTYQAVRHGPPSTMCAQHPWQAAIASLLITINGQCAPPAPRQSQPPTHTHTHTPRYSAGASLCLSLSLRVAESALSLPCRKALDSRVYVYARSPSLHPSSLSQTTCSASPGTCTARTRRLRANSTVSGE